MLQHVQGFVDGVGDARTRRTQTDASHRVLEFTPVFGLVDGLFFGAYHFHAELFQHSLAVQVQRAVQRCLPTHGRQQRVGPFLFDDAGDGLPVDGFDVGGIGHFRVGHDRRRVGVDQDDPVTLLFQRLAGLRPGIVEFTGLADHDGTCA